MAEDGEPIWIGTAADDDGRRLESSPPSLSFSSWRRPVESKPGQNTSKFSENLERIRRDFRENFEQFWSGFKLISERLVLFFCNFCYSYPWCDTRRTSGEPSNPCKYRVLFFRNIRIPRHSAIVTFFLSGCGLKRCNLTSILPQSYRHLTTALLRSYRLK